MYRDPQGLGSYCVRFSEIAGQPRCSQAVSPIHSCEMLEDLCDTCFTESVWWASSFGLFDILWNNFESNNELRHVYDSSSIKANHARQHYQISSLFSLHPFLTSKRTSIIIILFLTKSVYCLCYRRKIVYYNKYLSQDINKVILQSTFSLCLPNVDCLPWFHLMKKKLF